MVRQLFSGRRSVLPVRSPPCNRCQKESCGNHVTSVGNSSEQGNSPEALSNQLPGDMSSPILRACLVPCDSHPSGCAAATSPSFPRWPVL
ncbi:hypothetical protein SORBI_3009G142300 [Sorghum bicolor]|uniref:Uncharacterized protein n=1 Tax=Sorghum bicolor TaxID=4558 RepID=A0A1B6P8T9_SORBI|nr:hypothetical protein SORBI_3009G142300 [Sorghum bicolor]